MNERLKEANGDPKSLGGQLYDRLALGDAAGAVAILNANKGILPDIGHYEPWFETIVTESFDSMVLEDHMRGRRAAEAIATWSQIMDPMMDVYDKQPWSDDVFRAKLPKDPKPGWASNLYLRSFSENQLIGYAYHFAYNDMTQEKRTVTRREIKVDDDLLVGRTVDRQKHDPRPHRQRLRRLRPPRSGLQLLPLFRRDRKSR